jgi:hypothetical protein
MDEGHKSGAAATIAERQAAQRGIFNRADADQNGRLDAEELAAYLFPEEAQREEAAAPAADDAKAFVQVGGWEGGRVGGWESAGWREGECRWEGGGRESAGGRVEGGRVQVGGWRQGGCRREGGERESAGGREAVMQAAWGASE